MNSRERMLAAGVLGVLVLVAVVFLFHQLYLVPLQERNANIQTIRHDIETKQEQIQQVQAELPRLERGFWGLVFLGLSPLLLIPLAMSG